MTENNSFFDRIMHLVNDPDRFTGKNRIIVTEIKEGYAKGTMPNIPATQNSMGSLHGGALSTLADIVAAVAVVSLGNACVTIENTMRYEKRAEGAVTCEAKVVKTGSLLTECTTVITDSRGDVVSTGTFSFFHTGETLEEIEARKRGRLC